MSYPVLIRIDKNDSRILHIEWTNNTNVPQSTVPKWSSFQDTKKVPDGFKLFMVTRRSSVNPDEVAKIRVELERPAREYPPKAHITIVLDSFDNQGPHVLRVLLKEISE
jgi:hypothetical protein